MFYYSTKQKIFRVVSIVVVLVFAAGGLFFYYNALKVTQNSAADQQLKQIALEEAKTKEDAFVSDVSSVAKDAPKIAAIPSSIPKSENFQMREVVFGGYETSMGGEIKDEPLKIYDVHSEVLTSAAGKEAKLYISWKTNKLAISQVIYSKNAATPNILLEDGLGFSHALIIGKFDFDTRYTYTVKAKDRWGNPAESSQFSAYSGQKVGSVIDLIANEFRKMFSWTGATK